MLFREKKVQGTPMYYAFYSLSAYSLSNVYADDTVLVAESPEELQKTIDSFHFYCKRWNLKMNIDKSKILKFSKGRQTGELQFRYDVLHVWLFNSADSNGRSRDYATNDE